MSKESRATLRRAGVANLIVGSASMAVIFAAWANEIEVGSLMRDPGRSLEYPLHLGVLSHTGVLIWAVGGGALLLAGLALRATDRASARLFLGVGVLTIVLAADDLMRFHEDAGMGPLWLGIPQVAIIGLYGVITVALLWGHRRLILGFRARWVLAASLAAFAVSVVVDFIGGLIIIEDSFKLAGILNWTLAWTSAGLQRLRAGQPSDVASGQTVEGRHGRALLHDPP